MKKYVLNIDKLYAGQTANALVLIQPNSELPFLIPNIADDYDGSVFGEEDTVGDWIDRIRLRNPGFKPEQEFEWVDRNQTMYDTFFNSPDAQGRREEINTYIIDFNLDLQSEFKKSGKPNLYMMDDTQTIKPSADDLPKRTFKTYLHNLNSVYEKDESMKNSSQLNVLFPFKKNSIKSLFASKLTIDSSLDIDERFERSRNVTLQGKVSYQDCVQGVAGVGNNLYSLSPCIDIGDGGLVFGNALAVMNGHESPFAFKQSLTLFQTSHEKFFELQDENGGNLVDVVNDFKDWYESHNHKTRVSFKDLYGTNVATMKLVGPKSYDIVLPTYSPTDIVLMSGRQRSSSDKCIRLISSTYRQLRADGHYIGKKYILDNDDLDGGSEAVGFMFNLYDTFITESDRILKVQIPRDRDFNKKKLHFDWTVLRDPGLLGNLEVSILIGESTLFDEKFTETTQYKECVVELDDMLLKSSEVDIVVRIRFDVDFGKRNSEFDYRQKLIGTGVLLSNFRIEDEVVDTNENLTFGSYVNEPDIS